jgi:signal transduction histidine kinase
VINRTFIALVILVTGASVFLFNSFYKEAKKFTIAKLNEEQTIHAKQAAQGIEDFFSTWTRNLTSLSKMDSVIDNDAVGKNYLKLFYEANHELVESITRLDERGTIIYNFPSNGSVGNVISDQKHVRELLRDHKPVISDVFKAVEGFDSVALHVPIFRGNVFKGSIGILINFKSLAKRYIEVIKIGETGYAWVVSREGTVLYSPVPGVIGKYVFEIIKDYPSLIVMVNEMLKGHEGAAAYSFDRIGAQDVEQTRKYAIYMPVQIGSTFWSIAVASAEQDVLSGLISFRNKLALVIGTLFICGMLFSTLGAKAWLIVKEEEKRKQVEKQLRDSEQNLRSLTGRLISAQEEERSRIARELHDDITQRLAVLAIEIGKLELQPVAAQSQWKSEVGTVKNSLIKVSEDIHAISRKLHPSIIDDLGLVKAIQSESAAFTKREGIDVTFRHEAVPGKLPKDITLALFRVIQESLRNIARHSQAKSVYILVNCSGNSINLSISDSGVGFDPQREQNKAGLGLVSMRERVKLIGGTISVDSEPGEGTVINVCVPLDISVGDQ